MIPNITVPGTQLFQPDLTSPGHHPDKSIVMDLSTAEIITFMT